MGLEEERKRVSFDTEDLTRFLSNLIMPEIPLERFRDLRNKILRIPDLNYTLEKYSDSRPEALNRGLRFGIALKHFSDQENLTIYERKQMWVYYPELSPLGLHYDFFMPLFALQASEEQKAEWYPKANNLEILGCYAQTELSHGSNVKGIETLAVYDEQNDEFVINSPSITSWKWWVGALGITATHALLVARLILKGQDYGPHAFLVQIRDLKTHEPLSGINVGELGPKLGLPANDNGFLSFNHYRVPNSAMLNRFARVNKGGEYEVLNPNSIKILYSSLLRARINLIRDTYFPLAAALTIAIRYSFVREQFSDYENPAKERQLIDYQMQRYKIFKVLASLYANLFTRRELSLLYAECQEKTKTEDYSMLGDLHGLFALFKAFITGETIIGAEECRRSCGGHGYSLLSGLPTIYMDGLPACTYDGDNSIMILQFIKYLTSLMNKSKNIPAHFNFLLEPMPTFNGPQNPACPCFQQKCFHAIALFSTHRLMKRAKELMSKGNSSEKTWSDILQIESIQTGTIFYGTLVNDYFMKGISTIENQNLREPIENLRQIFAIVELEKHEGWLLRVGVDPATIDEMKGIMLKALAQTRNNALGLIEAFEIPDQTLNSVIGRKDGKIYPELVRAARYLNPTNQNSVFPGIHSILRPKL